MKIELTGPHTHQGKALSAGAVIDVDESTGRWLIEHGPAKTAGSARKAKPDTGAVAGDPLSEVQE